MRAGKLRHWITIQTRTDTRDSYGEPISTWTTFDQVWASIEPIAGREYFASKETRSQSTHRMRIRYRSGITTKMRISWDSRLFDIESILNTEERDRELILMCVETGI